MFVSALCIDTLEHRKDCIIIKIMIYVKCYFCECFVHICTIEWREAKWNVTVTCGHFVFNN
jgi:hypothetical protein